MANPSNHDATPLVVIPIRSFDGMLRLAEILGEDERHRLMRGLAQGVAQAATAAGARLLVVTNDQYVVRWAAEHQAIVVPETGQGGLDSAASLAIAGTDGPWAVVHADLPMIRPEDIEAIFRHLDDRPVLAPSKDGGTSVVASKGRSFPFQYGPLSFFRHLAAVAGRAHVRVRPGLAIDVDRPADLEHSWVRA